MGCRAVFANGLVAILFVCAGCGGGSSSTDNNAPTMVAPTGQPPTDPDAQPLCDPTTTANGFAVPTTFPLGITPSPAVDYLEERSETAFETEDADAGVGASAASADGYKKSSRVISGAACANATDRSACESKLASIRVLPSEKTTCVSQFKPQGQFVQPGCATSYMIYTRGDEVSIVTNIKQFLGPIDTKEEVLWLLRSQNIHPFCSTSKEPPATIKSLDATSGGGFELRFQKNCEKTPTLFT